MDVQALYAALAAVCPVDGVSGDGVIWFHATATPMQQAAAHAIVQAWTDPAPFVTCQLWQLQAVMTPAQWTAAQGVITSLNNPILSAFFQHGTNVIPSNSTTLISLGAALSLTPAQVTALVTQASTVALP